MEWFIGSGMPHTPDYFISVKVGNSTISINKNKPVQYHITVLWNLADKKTRLIEGFMLHKGKDKPQAFIDKSRWKDSKNHY